MAVVWEKQSGQRRYSVVRAGNSVRLYTNGVFHSQYNPRQPVAGNVWDLLFLPTLMHPRPRQLKRVLVLGVGGGAVVRQLNSFLQPEHIVGVDLDSVHLQVARRFFGADEANVELVHAEARGWLRHYAGPAFDVIVEDLFADGVSAEGTVEPLRAIAADDAWFGLLAKHLGDDGVLIMNFESGRSLSKSAWRGWAGADGTFSSVYRFSCSRYENVIGAFLRVRPHNRQFMNNLQQFKLLDQRRKSCRLEFSYRKL